MTVLFLLAVFVAFFAFTLGVHFGKRLTPDPAESASTDEATEGTDHAAVEEGKEKLPEKAQLTEASKDAPVAGDDSVAKALQDEVAKTGLKLEKPIQTELPSDQAESTDAAEEAASGRPSGKFTLQVAAFPTESEAQRQLKAITQKEENEQAFLSKAEVNSQTWFRVYVGGYATKNDADSKGKRLVAKKVISTFVVAKMPK